MRKRFYLNCSFEFETYIIARPFPIIYSCVCWSETKLELQQLKEVKAFEV
jgi:hypothetical protein